LHQTALGGHLAAVQLLVDRGARLDQRDTVYNGTNARMGEARGPERGRGVPAEPRDRSEGRLNEAPHAFRGRIRRRGPGRPHPGSASLHRMGCARPRRDAPGYRLAPVRCRERVVLRSHQRAARSARLLRRRFWSSSTTRC
jgi:hypothetical protein